MHCLGLFWKECRHSLSLYFNKQKQMLERPSAEPV
jgi:hypothetical protein